MKTITELGLTYEQARKYVERSVCQCGSWLLLAWGGVYRINDYVIRCSKDPAHNDFERPLEINPYSSSDMPGWKLSRERRTELEKKIGTEKTRVVMKYQGVATSALSKPEIMDIISTIWPRAVKESPTTVKKALLICYQMGLNPLMNQLALMPFTSKKDGRTTWAIALTIKSNRILAHRHGGFSYVDNTPRFMSEKEQMEIRGFVDTENIWFITKLKDERGNTAQGYGSWPKMKEPHGADKGNTKENMAAIRSERQALDRLFPEPLLQGTAVVDESQINNTGAIEGEYTEVTGEGEPESLIDETEPEGEEKAGEQGKDQTGAGGSETDLSSQKGKGEKPPEESAAAKKARDEDILMAQSSASKLHWDSKRLMKELKERTGFASFDSTPDEKLHDFATKITDLATVA